MRKNKVLCAAMASAMSLSLLAGCGGNSASTAASASAAAGSSDTTAAADADTEEGKVLNERGLAKVVVGLARGRKSYDKREYLKENDARREMDKAMKNYR